MKNNVTLGLIAVLGIAVIVLFYLHFSSTRKNLVTTPATAGKSSADAASAGPFRIAYFEMDSIESHYEYMKDVRNTLRASEQSKNNELSGIRNQYRSKLQEYQQKGNSMTQEQIAAANEELMRLDNMVKGQEEQKGRELQDESYKKLQGVKKRIEDYLKEYNKDKNYSFIFANISDLMYYKDSVYNITSDVLKGLNEDYKKNK